MHPASTNTGPFKGWHAFLWFAGFFGFMFVVNGIFLWTAITTFPGEDVPKSYLTGLAYNQELDRRARQAAAGWITEIGFSEPEGQLALTARLLNRDGSVLVAHSVSADIRHPADRAHDRALELTARGNGEYSASVGELPSGVWTIVLMADVDPHIDGHELHAERKVYLP